MRTPLLTLIACVSYIGTSSQACDPYDIVVTGYESSNLVAIDLETMNSTVIHQFDADYEPFDVTMREDETLFVSLRGPHDKVVKLTPNGSSWNATDFTGVVGNYGPGHLGFDSSGRLLVAGDTERVVFIFNPNNGKITDTFTNTGCCNIVGMKVQQQKAYVSEYFQGRVWVANLQSSPISTTLLINDQANLAKIHGIELDTYGRLYVASADTETVGVYDAQTGQWIESWNAGSEVRDVFFHEPMDSLFAATNLGLVQFSMSGTLINTWTFPDLTFLTGICAWTSSSLPSIATWEQSVGGNGHTYEVRCADGVITWDEADLLARQAGGHLATITSAAENDWLFNTLASSQSLYTHGWWGPWLGGRQSTSQPDYSEPAGGWIWTTTEPMSYTNWLPGQPDNGHGGAENAIHFVGINGSIEGKWNDFFEDDLNPVDIPCAYIIEYDNDDCPGDANSDGQVNVTDLLLVISAWGACP